MSWIARYVAQVKSYLPAQDRDDVAAEINSLLEEKIADREEELQRDLDEQETFKLLREFGHPLRVATAYRNNGVLISSTLFPIYLLALRYLVVILVAVYAASLLAFYVTGNHDLWPGFSLGDLFDMGMFYFGAITLGFHVTDRVLQKHDWLADWNPRELPRAEAERESLFMVVFMIIMILAWFRLLSYIPIDHNLDELLGKNANRLATFILWLKIQAVLCLPAYIWLLVRPQWTSGKRLLIIASNLVVIVGGAICLSIDKISFVNAMETLFPEWESSLGIGNVSTLIISIWMFAITLDSANHLLKIWREFH